MFFSVATGVDVVVAIMLTTIWFAEGIGEPINADALAEIIRQGIRIQYLTFIHYLTTNFLPATMYMPEERLLILLRVHTRCPLRL